MPDNQPGHSLPPAIHTNSPQGTTLAAALFHVPGLSKLH